MLKIIIGLPCSGKTYLSKEFQKNGYVIYDDFITNFYNGQLLNDNSEKICINDPRLCNYQTFLKFIEYFQNKKIELILFENNPDQCLINLKKRKDGRKGVDNSIIFLSKKYDLNNYKECTILKVFSN